MYDRRRRLGDDTLGRVRANNRREGGGIRNPSDAPGIAFRILFVQIFLEAATSSHAERKPLSRLLTVGPSVSVEPAFCDGKADARVRRHFFRIPRTGRRRRFARRLSDLEVRKIYSKSGARVGGGAAG